MTGPLATGVVAAGAVGLAAAAGSGLARRRRRAPLPTDPVGDPTGVRRTVPASVVACCAALPGRVDPAAVWPRLALGGAATTALLAWRVGPLPAAVVGVGLLAAPRLARPGLERRRHDRRDAQLGPFLERLAAALRAGLTLRAACTAGARGAPPPLGHDLRPLADALDHGEALEAALARWGSAVGAGPEVRLVAGALALGAQAGGEVARAVDGVAATLRERREVRAEAAALATQARASAALLVVAPLGFAAVLTSVQPGTVAFLVGTPAGLACLGAGVALDAVGAWWMARIVRSAG